ncbi:MAG: Crp/Fnr family transcriptional regulator [Thermodesulfovibrio sp.]|nr:Crp/Fnr family transcriptional regulator [Thermodesulfovibrio sp.]
MKINWHFTEKDFFRGLPSEKQDFIAVSTPRLIKRNQLIFLEEDKGNSAFYLEEGEVKIYRISPLGKESIVFIRHAGEMFGLAELIGGQKRLCNAQAITKCRLHEIKKADFELLLQRHYSLARRVIEILGKRLRYLGEQIESLMVCDVTNRLLKLLTYLGSYNLFDLSSLDRPIAVPVRLTQEQIAAMIGSCQQTVSETLKKLKEDGVIEISKKEIILLKPKEILNHIL